MPCNNSIATVGNTPVTISLYHLIWMTKKMPNNCTKLSLLNNYLKSPSRVEELYVLGILNTSTECRAEARFNYSAKACEWQWY
jgi:hypothetical protein